MEKVIDLLKEAVCILEGKEEECGHTCKCADESNDKLVLSAFNPGDVIKGNQNDTEFIVLDHFEDGTTLVGTKGLMFVDIKFDENEPNYKGSNLQQLIEDNCLPIFESDFGAENLVEREIDLTTVDMQQRYENVSCKVRPLTFDEARKYNDLLVNKELPDWWWLITPWSTEERGWKYGVSVVSPSGRIRSLLCNYYFGVRPFCILKSSILVSKGE